MHVLVGVGDYKWSNPKLSSVHTSMSDASSGSVLEQFYYAVDIDFDIGENGRTRKALYGQKEYGK